MPVRARLPMVKQEVVNGRVWDVPPIFRISCSSFKLWIIDPEHMNNMALKKACMQMWRKARCGWLIPRVTIISPSWLDVENATIFLISFWVSAQIAVNSVVIEPKHIMRVRIVLLFEVSGKNRIIRKIPATTIVLEWRRADTGVGPSMAAGSHGCNPNWADFPVAASKRPSNGMMLLLLCMKICCISHELWFRQNHVMAKINPMSPMRLYRMACSAAVFASVRLYHQPMSMNDMMPTPSHPMNSWNRLLAEVRIIIVIKNIRRYLMKRLRWGSACIYQEENSMMDQVTNRATDINRMEKRSILRLIDRLIVLIVIQCQLETIDSML